MIINKLVTLAVLLAAMTVAHAQTPAPAGMTTVLTGSEGRILLGLPPEPAKHEKLALWTPTARDIARMEQALPALTKMGQPSDLKFDAAAYDRQYAGKISGGQKLIVISGVRPELATFLTRVTPVQQHTEQDWHTHTWNVADGGQEVFHAVYKSSMPCIMCRRISSRIFASTALSETAM